MYRVAWGIAPDDLCELFKWKAPAGITGYLRSLSARHAWQFEEPINYMGIRHTDAVARSAFGSTIVWNKLPVEIVWCPSIKLFQRRLQRAVIETSKASTEFANFFDNAKRMTVPEFQRYFET